MAKVNPVSLEHFLNSDVSTCTLAGARGFEGDLFGVELECEGKQVDQKLDLNLLKDWKLVRDGSLRNNHGSSGEWVFTGPANYGKSVERIKALFENFNQVKAKLVTSNRTSTHVHYNVKGKKVYQVINLYILFTILEDILDTFCGEDRKGNLFCLSSRLANSQLEWVTDACFENFSFVRLREDQRYCSLNLASLNKFNSVEFRGMRGVDNEKDLLDWLSIINEFCDYACYKMRNPSEIIEKISKETPLGLLKEIFSENNFNLLTANLTEDQISSSIYDGIHLIQMLSYRIGFVFDKVKVQGKDFWASFAEGGVVEERVLPGEIRIVQPRPRGAAVRLDNVRLENFVAQEEWLMAQPLFGNNPAVAGPRLAQDDINEALERVRALRLRQNANGIEDINFDN